MSVPVMAPPWSMTTVCHMQLLEAHLLVAYVMSDGH